MAASGVSLVSKAPATCADARLAEANAPDFTTDVPWMGGQDELYPS
jgi:hypothetical protein